MAISPPGWFDYSVVLTCDGGIWAGDALDSDAKRAHPGLVGRRPIVDVRDGVVTLHRSQFDRASNSPASARWRNPDHRASFDVGPLIERIAADGDVLFLTRGGSGDLGWMLTRAEELLAAVGALGPGVPGFEIEDDPRAHDEWLFRLKYSLDDPAVRLVWIDAGEADVVKQLESLREELPTGTTPSERLLIAVGGGTATQRQAVAAGFRAQPPISADRRLRLEVVSERFRTPDEWTNFIRGLPHNRPADLHVRFTSARRSVDVVERHGAFVEPWHLFVSLVNTPGIPGRHSHVAIVRDHPQIDRTMVKDACDAVTRGLHRRRWEYETDS